MGEGRCRRSLCVTIPATSSREADAERRGRGNPASRFSPPRFPRRGAPWDTSIPIEADLQLVIGIGGGAPAAALSLSHPHFPTQILLLASSFRPAGFFENGSRDTHLLT